MDWWALAEKYGFTVVGLMFTIWALYTDRVVSGHRYREVVRQRDSLLKLALSGQRKAWQATDLASALAPGAGESEAGHDPGD